MNWVKNCRKERRKMKSKILIFVIGLLTGAIITAICFLAFGGSKGPKDFDQSNFREGKGMPPNFSEREEKFDFYKEAGNKL